MNTRVYTLGTAAADQWREILQRCGTYDVYHLPEYHRLAEEQEGVQAVLFVYETPAAVVAMPLLLRQLAGLPGIDASGYHDVTSVYGYPGPVSTLPCPPREVTRCFAESLRDYLASEGVISAFSRLHPLFDQEPLLKELGGQVLEVGPTVAVDLRLPPDEQWRQYRKGHRYDINKVRREKVACVHDVEWKYLDQFIGVYYDSMHRAGAADCYFFDRAYFTRLRELLGDHLHLFVALQDNTVLAGALFTVCNAIMQYHLAGSDSRYLDLASSKVILDAVRLWGMEIGIRIFHLGGGVGSREDGLFRFKAGFSKLRYRFKVWRMGVNQAVYHQLVQQKRAWNKANGLETIDDDFFPAYRCPVQTIS